MTPLHCQFSHYQKACIFDSVMVVEADIPIAISPAVAPNM